MIPLVYHPDYNITAFGLERLQIGKALVVDLDAHQGNGTASVLQDWPWAAIFDLYERDNFPARKEPEDYPMPARSGLTGVEYLGIVQEALPVAIDAVWPDLLIYNAGADNAVKLFVDRPLEDFVQEKLGAAFRHDAKALSRGGVILDFHVHFGRSIGWKPLVVHLVVA